MDVDPVSFIFFNFSVCFLVDSKSAATQPKAKAKGCNQKQPLSRAEWGGAHTSFQGEPHVTLAKLYRHRHEVYEGT